MGCEEICVEAGLDCLESGGGPEDPLADACAVLVCADCEGIKRLLDEKIDVTADEFCRNSGACRGCCSGRSHTNLKKCGFKSVCGCIAKGGFATSGKQCCAGHTNLLGHCK